MGKYMKKTKADCEVAVMEVIQSSLGVRTRAKTLALRRFHSSSPPEAEDGSGSYLQLRNRRLQKPPVFRDYSKRPKQALASKGNSGQQNPKLCSGSDGSVSLGRLHGEDVRKTELGGVAEEKINNGDVGIEASFGENVLEVEGRERSTRESTPCNLIRDPDVIRTPGSTTRSSGLTGASRRVQSSVRGDIPSSSELDEFFTAAEKEQQKTFTEKYNFDPVTDRPISGRFEWEKVDV